MPRCSIILTLLALSLSGCSYAQSLGEVAREVRAEKQKSGVQQPKVITNEDIANSVPIQERDVTKQGSAKMSEIGGTDKPPNAATEQPPITNHGEHPKQSADEDRHAQELEHQQRTNNINQRYMDRIATLRDQIKDLELQVAKLQVSYEPTDNEYYAYEALIFNQHVIDLIEEDRKQIANLKSQLAAIQEEARHAGVPHATD